MIDLVLHAVGGALLALMVLAWPPGLAALVVALVVGYVREAEQRPKQRWMPWRWTTHALAEMVAWPIGAFVALAGYALS